MTWSSQEAAAMMAAPGLAVSAAPGAALATDGVRTGTPGGNGSGAGRISRAVRRNGRQDRRPGGGAGGAGTVTGAAVTPEDRQAEDAAVAARLDRAWRRLDAARAATEGRPGGIGDDTARRDPMTTPFPIVFGTPARTSRTAGAPLAENGHTDHARPLRRPQVAAHRRHGEPTLPRRSRAARPLTVDRWTAAAG